MKLNQRETVQKVALFQGISDDEYLTLINCLSPQVKHFAKNEILLLTGDYVHHVGIILDGEACAYLSNVDGSHTLISSLMPMSVFGEVLASTRTHKSPVTIYAVSDVSVALIDYQNIYSMCETACSAHRIFLQNMIKTIGDNYFSLFDRIAILREKTLRAKLKAYLYTLSDNGKTTTVTIPCSKTMLADYLLVNRSALSKELRKMECDGLITINRREIKLHYIL